MSARRSSQRRPRGFALMLAVFLIVTLAAIGAYLVTISTGQVEAVVQDEQGARAYQAARSGVEWGAYRLLRDATCVAPTTLTLTQGFVADVKCQQIAMEKEGGLEVHIYKVTSTGCKSACGAPADPAYVERELELTLTREL